MKEDLEATIDMFPGLSLFEVEDIAKQVGIDLTVKPEEIQLELPFMDQHR